MKEIRWHGRGGQGGFTAARLLGMAASRDENYYAQAFPSFGPERRGAPVLGFTRIDNQAINDHSMVYTCDYVVVLDETLLEVVDVTSGLKRGGTLIVNSAKTAGAVAAGDFNVYTIDATQIALEILRQPITNTAMFGAFVAVSELVSLDAALEAVDLIMPEELRGKNKATVKRTYLKLWGEKHG